MRRAACSLFLLVLLAFVSTGCGGKAATETASSDEPMATPEEILVGNWEGAVEVNQEAVAEKLEAVKDLDDRAKNRAYWAIETPASLKSKLTLKADGSMKMTATISTAEGEKNHDGEGRWEVLAAGGDQATVRLSYEGQVEEKVFTFEDKDAFATDPPGVDKTIGTLKFKRLR